MKSLYKRYNLNLDDKESLLKSLEDISFNHSFGNGLIFSTPRLRTLAHQLPLKGVETISLNSNPKEEKGYNELKEIIKSNLEPRVIVYRNPKTAELVSLYFLPKAINKDPSRRVLESGLHWLMN